MASRTISLHDAGLSSVHHLVARASSTSVDSTSSSASSLVTTLILSGIPAIAFVVGFIILRRSYRRQYMPRTYLGVLDEHERTPATPTGLWNWVKEMYKLPDTYVLQHHSLDAYLFLRFVKLASIMCLVGCLITWPVLFPLNATGGGTKKQLDILSMSNIKDQFARYYGHCFCAWAYVGYIFYTVTREYIFFITLRQAYALSPAYASRMSSRTVLFTAVTPDYLDRDKIRQMFGAEKVKNVWIATDTSDLEDKVKQRDGAAMKLEAAETKLIRKANAARLKAIKKGHADQTALDNAASDEADDESGSIAARWIRPKDRPTHRLTMLIGKKVDTINWARSEIERLSPEIEELQAKHRAGDADMISSVFVEFHRQTDAQSAYQSVAHNLPLHMSPRYIGLNPNQVIWSNLRIKWWERLVRYSATMALVVAMIIFWAIPVAVVGSISNINYLTDKVHFLSFINKLPSFLLGIITGYLPTILMAVLMALVPIFLRLMAKMGGAASLAEVELTVQNWYFAFEVVQVFLVVTIASSASSVVTKIIQDPTSAANLLANNIPLASNFYISYIVLQGLSFAAGALLQISGLIVGMILSKLFDSTPRKMYNRWSNLSGLGWGTIVPAISLLLVIAITYSCIAPLVLGFATVGLYLFYFAYRYNLLYVSNATIDTQGKIYARALQHTLVGCYLLMVCLIGLFAIGSASNTMAVGPLVLMIIFLVFCILYHMSLNAAMEPLVHYLPKNLEAEEESLLAEERPKLGVESDNKAAAPSSSAHNGTGNGNGVEDVMDAAEKGLPNTVLPPAHQKPNLFAKYLRPDKYTDYATLRRLVPNAVDVAAYAPEVERDAYFHPSITSQVPLLWIPRDEMGISKQEIQHTSRVIPITDDDAWLDEKNKIHWDMDKGQPPIYEEKVSY
ncbi:hypothetical protein ASPZODRAFT_11678 [Penicilliopsis zonata CBS 506.65]|uniref:CSC1/OSCA1-like 7TM region domain-containing protein n=1 Tax=Penicilliopsis zonata CBS 506.65 TaxID=1073090 RepID=A0A1L9SUN1_9EURO|nr:hypothetical protein ASPZODRAFT_11678 [Penicilliopsis zonata CBS 506.65]OJJ50831.1 hypothetical protein ASPZODRAFT_11678 [Penicilliopsis zonata CBS 506.65]